MIAATGAPRLLGFSFIATRGIVPIRVKNPQSGLNFAGLTLPKRTNVVRLWSAPTNHTEEQKLQLEEKIKAKGDEIRALKASGAEKSVLAPVVEELLALKAELDPASISPNKKQSKQEQHQNSKGGKDESSSTPEEESDFITARAIDYSKW